MGDFDGDFVLGFEGNLVGEFDGDSVGMISAHVMKCDMSRSVKLS